MQINNKYNFSNDKIRDIRNIKINENRIEILLIDLYHLGILSEYKMANNGNKIKVKLESIKNNFNKKLMKYDLCLKEYLKLD